MVPREGGHTQIPRASKGPACLGLGVLRQGRPRPASQPDGALGERAPCPGPSRVREPGPVRKNFQVLGRGSAGLEFLVARVRGKVLAPARVVPQKVFSPIGQVREPLRELPFCLRGAWDFGWLRPDLSLASEPAWRVRWLVRVGRPRARLGGSAPATGTSATGQATDSVGSFASVGPGGAERGSGICPPRRGPPRRARPRTT